MNKKTVLLVYIVFLLLALPVAFLLAKTSQENRSNAGSNAASFSLAPNTAQILDTNSEVKAHIWLNTGSTTIAFVKTTLKFDNTKLTVTDISNLTNQLQTTIESTSVEKANTDGKIVLVKALDAEHRNSPPSGAIDFATITFKKKADTGTLTTNNITFKKTDTDIQVVEKSGSKMTIETSGAKYQTSVGENPTNTPSVTTNPSVSPTVTKKPTATSTPKLTSTPPNLTEVTGKVVKVTCWRIFFCYQLTNTSDGQTYFLWSRPLMKIMGADGIKFDEPIDPPILNAWRKIIPTICLDDKSDPDNCTPIIPGLNFNNYLNKIVTIKGYKSTLDGKNILAVTSIKTASTVTPTSTPVATATPTSASTPTPTVTPLPNAESVLNYYLTKNTFSTKEVINGMVKLATGTNKVSAVDLRLRFDPSFMKINSLTANSAIFQNTLSAADIDNTNGVAKITVATSNPTGVNGSDFTVATFEAKVFEKTGSTKLYFGPNTTITALGISNNVLKQGVESTITINQAASITGDINKSGKVDIFDYNLLLENFGNTTCGNIADTAPVNRPDCKVDIFDYNVLLENFGKTAN